MVHPAASYVSYEQYLEAEVHGLEKHEWHDGVVYAMAGGTLEHSRLAGNIHAALKTALGGCEVFQADAMLFVRARQLSTYADVSVVCGPVESQKVERNGRTLGEALLNPTIIVEVLSPSTAEYDRGEKFGHYMTLASLREYVLVLQDSRQIEVYRRPERGHWHHVVARAGEQIEIGGHPIAVDEIYRRAT
ncbi:MAG: Uma2 family endonuclease [Kofleriaceae bacterium]|nr:Uma2 family endonuclease [Kofleriaceae bacterium]